MSVVDLQKLAKSHHSWVVDDGTFKKLLNVQDTATRWVRVVLMVAERRARRHPKRISILWPALEHWGGEEREERKGKEGRGRRGGEEEGGGGRGENDQRREDWEWAISKPASLRLTNVCMHVLLPLERLGVVLQRMIPLTWHQPPPNATGDNEYYTTNLVPSTTKERSYGRRQELIRTTVCGEDEPGSRSFGTASKQN